MTIYVILLLNNCNNIKIENFSLDKLEKYIINLDTRKDRFDITNNLLNQYDFKNIIRFPAIKGKNISNNEYFVNICYFWKNWYNSFSLCL